MHNLTDKEIELLIGCGSKVPSNPDYREWLIKETAQELKHYRSLKEQGRLIELPCVPGEEVWIGHRIYSFGEFTTRTIYNSVSAIIVSMQDGFIIGKTKEEAEAKLKELIK